MNDKLRGPATDHAHHISPTSCQVLFHSFDIKRSASRARLDANGTTYSAGHYPASRSCHIVANYFSGLESTYRSIWTQGQMPPGDSPWSLTFMSNVLEAMYSVCFSWPFIRISDVTNTCKFLEKLLSAVPCIACICLEVRFSP
jgi:hypothetical protein